MMILHRNNFKASIKAANHYSKQLEEEEKKSESNRSNLILSQSRSFSTVNYDEKDAEEVNLEEGSQS